MIEDLRENRLRAAEQASPEASLTDSKRLTEYIENVHKLMQASSEEHKLG